MYRALGTFEMRAWFSELQVIETRGRLILVILLSLSLHLMVLWLVWLYGQNGYDTVGKIDREGLATSMLSVRLVASEEPVPRTAAQLMETAAVEPVQEAKPALMQEPSLLKQSPESDGLTDYYPAGRLTRLPFPLSHINLNVFEIDEVAHEGAIELTIMVEADGTVSDVLTSVDHDSASLYAERIAARFRSSLFSPGEIDGKPVKSKARFTVVSEPLSQPGRTDALIKR